jgi:hypothetical protein
MNAFRVRAGGVAGIVAAVLMAAAGLITGSPPKPDDPASKIVAFLADKRTALRWQVVLFAAAMILLFWFTAAFCVLMSSRTPATLWAAVPLAGLTGIAAIAFSGAAPAYVVVWRGTAGLDPRLVQTLWDTQNVAASFVAIAAVVVFASAALLINQTGLLPGWLGWLAWLAALLNAVTIFAVFAGASSALAPGGVVTGLLGLLAAAVWILLAGITMLQADAPAVV